MTFTEYNRINWDWNIFLNQNKISTEDWKTALKKASCWVTCAVGNQCSVIPRNPYGEPEDRDLLNMGLKFIDHIVDKNVEAAKELLLKN